MTLTIILIICLPIVGILGYVVRAYIGKIKLNSSESKSQRILQDALKEAENKRKELIVDAKDQLLKDKNLFEKEVRERRQEVQASEKRLLQKEESIDNRIDKIKKQEKVIKKTQNKLI